MVSRGELLKGTLERDAKARAALVERGWLALTPADFQEALLAITIWRFADAGDEFIHAGDTKGGLFGIASGTAEVSIASGHPDTRFMHLAHVGFWGGCRPLLGKARNISIVARTDVVWALVPQSAMERLLREEPQFWRHLMLMSDMGYETSVQVMVDLTRQQGLSRVAATLLRLAGCRNHTPATGDGLEIRVPQADIAALAVMSRNTMGTYLAELTDMGLINVQYRCIRLRNVTALRALLDSEE